MFGNSAASIKAADPMIRTVRPGGISVREN